MSILNSDKKRGKYQNKIFLLLLLVATVPLLIAAVISYQVYMEELTKQTDLSMETIEEQLFNDVEVTLKSIKQYYMDIASDEEIQWLKNAETIPYRNYSNISEAQNVLKGPTYLDEYIKSYAYLNIKQGWILTNNGLYPVSDTRNIDTVNNLLNIINGNPSSLFWYNNVREPSPYPKGVYQSNTLDVSGYQLVMKMSSGIGQKDHIILVQLNIERLEQKLKNNGAEYEWCVLGEDGDLLFASNEKLGQYCSSYSESFDDQQPRNIKLEENLGYRLHIKKGGSNGLSYLLAYNTGMMKEGAGKLLLAFAVLIGVLIVILLICRILSMILYQPVRNLTSYVSEAAGGANRSKGGLAENDEFLNIRNNVAHLIDTKENLQNMVQQQKRMLIEQFLIRTARGEMTPDMVKRSQEQFCISRENVYRMLAITCMIEEETDSGSEVENEALGITIIERIPDEILKHIVAVPFHIGEQILVIVGDKAVESLREKTIQINQSLTDYIKEKFGCSVIVGISQVFTGLKYLRAAYNECNEMLRNVGTLSQYNNSVTFYDDIAENDGIINGYDFVIESSIIKAVNDGDIELSEQLVDKFVNSLNNRKITWHDRNFFIYRMTIAIIAVLSDAGLEANQAFKDQSNDVFLQLNYISESDKLKKYMNTQIIQPAIQALHEYRYNISSDVLHKITDIVHETHGDITLTECAERLNYHPSYIWKVLKAEWNMNFTDLSNMEKLNTAKEMLLHTNLSVTEIAQRLNYSNTQNFIRFFNKYVNTSPGKYRKEHKEEANSK
ncbi:AraC family transcriptional regulator [Hungatella hathewayi]|uniref:AraC family transcriptional regulator n=1 Tax=Hungatella hathewayi TaxID=154046 RepID=UPI0035684F3C